jgi:hypothetical protein
MMYNKKIHMKLLNSNQVKMKMNIINKRISNIIIMQALRRNNITMKKEGTIIKIKEEVEVEANIMIKTMERLIIIKGEEVEAITTNRIIRRKRIRIMIIKIQGVIIHKSLMKIKVRDMINILLNISSHIMMMESRVTNMKVILKLVNMRQQAIKINLIRERLLRSSQRVLKESNLRKKSINNLIKMWIRRDRQEVISLIPIDSKYSALIEDSLLKLYD